MANAYKLRCIETLSTSDPNGSTTSDDLVLSSAASTEKLVKELRVTHNHNAAITVTCYIGETGGTKNYLAKPLRES